MILGINVIYKRLFFFQCRKNEDTHAEEAESTL